MKYNLMLLFGGRSPEHEISLKSALSIYNVLKDNIKYNLFLVYVDKDRGIWYLEDFIDSSFSFQKSKKLTLKIGEGFFLNDEDLKINVVFPLIHGTNGEDGNIQGLLEYSNVAYIGADVFASSLSINKAALKVYLSYFKIPVVPFLFYRFQDFNIEREKILKNIVKELSFPIIVKPANLGSAIGINIANDERELMEHSLYAYKFDSIVIFEKFLKVREIESSVVGDKEIKVFPLGELVNSNFLFYDYDAKYNTPLGEGIDIQIPAKLSKDLSDKIKALSLKIYKLCGFNSYARIDFFLTEGHTIYLNEVNTIPGFTSISMFPMMCNAGGLNFSLLIDKLVDIALEKHKLKL